MRRRSLFAVVLALVAPACGAVRDTVEATSVSSCISKNCTNSEAQAYQQCEATCRNTYGGK
jgi:hypothetical protein